MLLVEALAGQGDAVRSAEGRRCGRGGRGGGGGRRRCRRRCGRGSITIAFLFLPLLLLVLLLGRQQHLGPRAHAELLTKVEKRRRVAIAPGHACDELFSKDRCRGRRRLRREHRNGRRRNDNDNAKCLAPVFRAGFREHARSVDARSAMKDCRGRPPSQREKKRKPSQRKASCLEVFASFSIDVDRSKVGLPRPETNKRHSSTKKKKKKKNIASTPSSPPTFSRILRN